MLIIDKYGYINGLKDYNPRTKFYFALGVMIGAMIINNQILYAGVFLLNLILITMGAKIPIEKYMKFLGMPVSFLILGIIPLLLSLGKTSNNFIYFIQIGDIYLGIPPEGMRGSLILFLRSLSSVSCTFFLILTTPINDLMVLLKKHRVPLVVIELMIFMYRFIFILLEETSNLLLAQNFKLGYTDIRSSYRSISILIASLFRRVMDRYQSLQYSLEARGFDSKFHM